MEKFKKLCGGAGRGDDQFRDRSTTFCHPLYINDYHEAVPVPIPMVRDWGCVEVSSHLGYHFLFSRFGMTVFSIPYGGRSGWLEYEVVGGERGRSWLVYVLSLKFQFIIIIQRNTC